VRIALTRDISSIQAAIAVLEPLPPALSDADIRALFIEGGPAGKRALSAASKQRIIADLKQIEQQASALRMTLVNLHPSTAEIFRNLDQVRRTLHTLEVIARETEVPDRPPALPKGTTSQQRLVAAYVFLETTGKKPTIINKAGQKAGGSFLDFLDAIFTARGVKSSRESSAKWAISAMKATKRGP
jgi:hypothetical protein